LKERNIHVIMDNLT